MIPSESDSLMSEITTMHCSRPQRWLLRVISLYQRFLSPLLPVACRFHPSCSSYAHEAVATHGVARGAVLAAARLARCHPWCEGGFDPVPPPPADTTGAAREDHPALKGHA